MYGEYPARSKSSTRTPPHPKKRTESPNDPKLSDGSRRGGRGRQRSATASRRSRERVVRRLGGVWTQRPQVLQTPLREQENGHPQKGEAKIEVGFEVSLEIVSHEGDESATQAKAGTKLVLSAMLFASHRMMEWSVVCAERAHAQCRAAAKSSVEIAPEQPA